MVLDDGVAINVSVSSIVHQCSTIIFFVLIEVLVGTYLNEREASAVVAFNWISSWICSPCSPMGIYRPALLKGRLRGDQPAELGAA